MPRTAKGAKIFGKMRQEYGPIKGKQVYYASIVKRRIQGAEGKGGTGKLAKAMATHAKKAK